MALIEGNARQLRFEQHLPAGFDDLLANGFHNAHEQVGADMGLGLPEDFLRRAGFDEQVRHMARPGAFDARGELAIGKRARAAFAELDVGARIKRAAGIEGVDCAKALVDGGAALHDKGTQAGARQIPGAEQARGAASHHDGARLARSGEGVGGIGHGKRFVGDVRFHVRCAFARRGLPKR